VKYAEGIKLLSQAEVMHETSASSDGSDSIDEIRNQKVLLFMNLAATNLKLGHFEGSRRCCNAAILFINRPETRLDDMGIDDDLTVDIPVLEPVNHSSLKFVLKALFRRSKSLCGMDILEGARNDLLLALTLITHSPPALSSTFIESKREIETFLKELEEIFSKSTNSQNNLERSQNTTIEMQYLKSISLINGGSCLLRQGVWTQSTTDCIVYIPISYFDISIKSMNNEKDMKLSGKLKWKVEFDSHSLKVVYFGQLLFYEELEYNICPQECYWMLEDADSSSTSSSNELANQGTNNTLIIIFFLTFYRIIFYN